MITFVPRPATTSFSGPEGQLKKMFRALRVRDKNAKWRAHMMLRRNGYFTGYPDQKERIEKIKAQAEFTKFYERRGDTFNTGLLPRVCRFLDKKNIKYKLEFPGSYRTLPKFKAIKEFHFVDKVEVRKEQIDAANEALILGRGIIHAATNAGKTEVAGGIIAEIERQTGRVPRVLFLVHRVGLVQQTVERFSKHLPASIRICMLGAGEKEVLRGPGVIVSTVQTASNLLGNPRFETFQEKCDCLFIDEFHLNKAWACSKIGKQNSAPMRIGLSGTIDYENKVKMLHYTGMTGPIISQIRNKELVDLGRSAKPIITFKEVKAEQIPKKLKYAGAYNLGIVKNDVRNEMVVRDVLRHLEKNRKPLVTVSRIAHGLTLKQMLEKRLDFRIEFLSGSSSIHHRKKVISQFEKGKVAVLIASPIFDTGVDIPAISGWVNAAGGKGWELVLQRLGRVLRRKKGVNKVWINDYVDKHNIYLFRHSLARIRHYQKENIGVLKIV